MRSIKTIEREIEMNRRIAEAPNLGPMRDNDGKIVKTAGDRRFSARQAITRLEAELANLRKVVDR